jgi:hypothetical protein
MKRSKNKKQKYLKGNQKVQFVKVNLSLKWKKLTCYKIGTPVQLISIANYIAGVGKAFLNCEII